MAKRKRGFTPSPKQQSQREWRFRMGRIQAAIMNLRTIHNELGAPFPAYLVELQEDLLQLNDINARVAGVLVPKKEKP